MRLVTRIISALPKNTPRLNLGMDGVTAQTLREYCRENGLRYDLWKEGVGITAYLHDCDCCGRFK